MSPTFSPTRSRYDYEENRLANDFFSLNPKRSRNNTSRPETWAKNIKQLNRMLGKSYKSPHKKSGKTVIIKRREKKLGPRCVSKICAASNKRFCNQFTEMERSDLFQNFWDLSWKEKQVFVCSHVEVRKPKEKKEGNSRRNYSFHYFLNLSGEQVEVCKQFFCTTLCLKEWTVHTWAKKKCLPHDEGTDDEFNNATVPMNEGRDSDEEDLDEPEERVTEKKCFLLQWFDMLQKLPSHYCRKDTKKLYLEERWKNKTDLYETYKAFAAEQNKSAVSRTFFCQVFHQLNLSIFSPKKDQCNKCVGHKSGNVSQKEWEQHILDKDRARIEKDSDKSRALRKDIICLCMDLQAVKVSPLTNASAMYYKLCSHNFTVYN